jgi:hypothetical protein
MAFDAGHALPDDQVIRTPSTVADAYRAAGRLLEQMEHPVAVLPTTMCWPPV